MAVTYQFYTGTYKGNSIATTDWDRLELRASEILNRYKKLFTITETQTNGESMAICAIADAVNFFEVASNSGAYASSSIGSVSTSQGGQIDLTARGQEKEYLRCIEMYLDVYRGVC